MIVRRSPLSLTAVALVVSSAACFTIIDTMVKYLQTRYSAPVIVLARWGIPALAMIVFLGPRLGWSMLRTAKPTLHVARAGVLILSSLAFFTALKFLPLAEATGLNYLTPTMVMLMSTWFLRERNTLARSMFAAAGCLGILLIVRPGYASLHLTSLLALGAAALNATFQILTRKLAGENLVVLAFYPSVVGTILMALAIPLLNHDASYMTFDICMLVGVGAIGGLGHCLLIQAFRRAPASAIAPFSYVQLGLSTLAGWLAFDAFPDRFALSGLIIIAGSAAIFVWHQNRHKVPSSYLSTALGAPSFCAAFEVPGAAATEIQFCRSTCQRTATMLPLAIGESTEIAIGGGARKFVLRTD